MDLQVAINLRSDVSILPPLSLFDNEVHAPYIRLFFQTVRASGFPRREETRSATRARLRDARFAKFLDERARKREAADRALTAAGTWQKRRVDAGDEITQVVRLQILVFSANLSRLRAKIHFVGRSLCAIAAGAGDRREEPG